MSGCEALALSCRAPLSLDRTIAYPQIPYHAFDCLVPSSNADFSRVHIFVGHAFDHRGSAPKAVFSTLTVDEIKHG